MESLSDIVAQMRGRGEDGRMDRHLWNEYADRIEAAAKRGVVSKTETTTVGNAAAMREALDAALRFIGNLEIEPYSPLDEAASELRQRIMDALSAPARQCDVGTPGKRDERLMLSLMLYAVEDYVEDWAGPNYKSCVQSACERIGIEYRPAGRGMWEQIEERIKRMEGSANEKPE